MVLTPAYAAPEQWYGTDPADLDGRTDLYALGGVLYRMLTGHTPFHADDYEGWAMQHIQTEPLPPSALRPELAGRTGLDQLILSLLAKQSEARPRNAGDLLPLLDEVQFGIVASRPSPARIVAEAAADAPVPEAALPQAPEERPSPFAASPEVDFQAETAAYTEEDLTASAAWGSIFAGAESAPAAAEDIEFVTVSPSIVAPVPSNASEELSAVAAPPSVAEREGIPEAVVAQPPIPAQTAASTDMPAVSASAAPAAATAEIAEEGENFREWLRNYERSDAGQSANSHTRKTATSSAAHEELSDEQRELLELQRMFRNANSAVRPEKKPTRAERMDRSNVVAELKKETEAAASKPAAQAPAPAAAQTVKKIVAEWGPVPAVVGLAPAAPIPAAPTVAQAVPQPAPPEAAVAAEETVNERFGHPLWKIAAALILLAVLGFAGWRLSYTDPKLPPAKLAQGCTAGDARSCTALAAWYEQTNVVKDGDARAVTFYGKACDASFPLACRKLAFKYLFGKGIPQDKPRAVPYFAKACNHGDYESCDTLADMYHNGTAVDQDDAQATQFYTKACTAGDDFGCEWATRLQAAHTTATAIHRPRPVATPESAE